MNSENTFAKDLCGNGELIAMLIVDSKGNTYS